MASSQIKKNNNVVNVLLLHHSGHSYSSHLVKFASQQILIMNLIIIILINLSEII